MMLYLLFVKSLNVSIYFMHSLQDLQEQLFELRNLKSVHKTSEHKPGTFSSCFFSETEKS